MENEFGIPQNIIAYWNLTDKYNNFKKCIFLLKTDVDYDEDEVVEHIRKTTMIDMLYNPNMPFFYHINDYEIVSNIVVNDDDDVLERYLIKKLILFWHEKDNKKIDLTEFDIIFDEFFEIIKDKEVTSKINKEVFKENAFNKLTNWFRKETTKETIDKYFDNKTLEFEIKPLYKSNGKFYIGLCYFNKFMTNDQKITFLPKTIIKLDCETYQDINESIKLISNNISSNQEKCLISSEIINSYINESKLDPSVFKKTAIDAISKNIVESKFDDIISFIKEMSNLKSDAKDKGIKNEEKKKEILEKNKDLLKRVISPKSFDRIYKDNNLSIKIEDILNILLSDNLWLLGHSNIVSKDISRKTADGNWKPDIVVRNKDKRLFVYELKRADSKVILWDSSHKSYYLSSDCTKAIAQIENQHQYLIENGAVSSQTSGQTNPFTKNDQLFIVIGNYKNELTRVENDEKNYYLNNGKDQITEKRKGIQLIRNKFKNAHILFYDELNFN